MIVPVLTLLEGEERRVAPGPVGGDANHVPGFAASVYVLERGEIVFSGSPELMEADETVRWIVGARGSEVTALHP